MMKQFEIRQDQEKQLTKLIKDFNEIATANGRKPIVPVKVFDKEIECVTFHTWEGHIDFLKTFRYTVPGAVYCIDVPDDVISFDGFVPIGTYYKNNGVWIRHMISDSICDQQDVREENFRCDHCGKKIARNGYWFFRNPDDALFVVGSSCVKKYFGINPEKLLLKLGKILDFVEDSRDNCYDGSDYFKKGIAKVSNDICYALVKYLTGDFTFWKKNDANGDGTASTIKSILREMSALRPNADMVNIYCNAMSNLTDEDKTNMEKVVEYWDNDNGYNDFAKNTKSIIGAGNFAIQYAGYASYGIFKAVNFYKNQKKNIHLGNFVGNLKERINKILIAKKSSHYEREIWVGRKTEFQCGSRLQFEDEDGNIFVSFTTSDSVIKKAEANMDKPVDYRFTIIEHRTERNGNKTNIINRMAVKQNHHHTKRRKKQWMGKS